MNRKTCDICTCPLEVCEGETYCPDCTHCETVREWERATDEALALLAIQHAEPDVMDCRGELPPY
jgi:uncharacterized Zn finger protein (UPF0148 family)